MKTLSAFLLTLFSCINTLYGQDSIRLINNDLLLAKVISRSPSSVIVDEEGIEREITSDFITSIRLSTNQKFNYSVPFSLGLTYDVPITVLKNFDGLEQDIERFFRPIVRREFKVNIENEDGQLTAELFRSVSATSSRREKEIIGYFRYLAYSCNAFLSTVSVNSESCQYVFYSNAISPQQIKNYFAQHSFKLIDSKVSGSLYDLIDKSIEPFVMTFLNDSQCNFIQPGTAEKKLNYSVNNNGSISFWDHGKKRERAKTWEVVSIEKDCMRYTDFNTGVKGITARKIQRIN